MDCLGSISHFHFSIIHRRNHCLTFVSSTWLPPSVAWEVLLHDEERSASSKSFPITKSFSFGRKGRAQHVPTVDCGCAALPYEGMHRMSGMTFHPPLVTRYSLLITHYLKSGSINTITAIIREDRIAGKAAGVYFSIVRNLWRLERLLGLRSARSRDAAQSQGRLVARHDPARRHRGPRRLDPHAPESVGSFRPCAEFLRPDGRLPRVQIAVSSGSSPRRIF